MNEEKQNIILSGISTVSRYLLLISAVIYGLGFLVVNGYLSQFNFYSLDILRARYLVAGVLAFICLAVSIYILAHFLREARAAARLYKEELGASVFPLIFQIDLFFLALWVETFAFSSVLSQSLKVIDNVGKNNFNLSWLYQHENYIRPYIQNFLPHYSINTQATIWLFTISFTSFLLMMLVVIAVYWLASKRHKNAQGAIVKKKMQGKSQDTSIRRKIFIIIFTAIIAGFMITTYVNSVPTLLNNLITIGNVHNQILNEDIIFSWIYGFVLFSLLAVSSTRLWQFRNHGELLKDINDNAYTYLALYLPLILSTLFFFGKVIYPKIPAQIGGGRPAKVSVIFNNKDLNVKKANYFLIDTTAHSYIFVEEVGKNRSAIEVRKDAIDQIRIIK